MREQIDSQLVGLAQAGDAEAYGRLFERYQSKIYNFAYSILGHAEDARDVTQDAFIRVFEALPGKQDLEFSPYVYRTARNLAYDVARARGRFIGDSQTALDAQSEDGLDAAPEDSSLFKEQQAKVRAAITALPTDYRAVLTLREIDEMSYQQIADSLGMPKNTVGVMISRARLKFRGAFRMQYVDADKLAAECKDMLPKLSAYIDGELKPGEVASVEEHLGGCPLCRLAVDEMREATRSYRAFIPLIPPAALKADVFSRFLHSPVSSGASGADQAATGDGGATPGGTETSGAQGRVDPGSRGHVDGPLAEGDGGAASADGRGGGADQSAETDLSQQTVKSLKLKKALKSPVLWALVGTGLLLLMLGGWRLTAGRNGGVDPSAGAGSQAGSAMTGLSSRLIASAVSATSTMGSSASIQTEVATDLTGDVAAPPIPSRTSPSDGALVSSDHVTLRWHSVIDPSGVNYGVEVQQWIGGGEGWQGMATKTTAEDHLYTSVPLKIRWRLWAVDGAGNRSAKSSWWLVVRAADSGGGKAAPSTTPTPSGQVMVPYIPVAPLR